MKIFILNFLDLKLSKINHNSLNSDTALLLTVRALLLTVELLCSQSVEVLIRRTFPL